MLTGSFKQLLNQWDANAKIKTELVTEPIAMSHSDSVKLEALAQLYALPKEEIIAQLIHLALLNVEEQMPYIPGPKVIRVEEGSEIYEDIGPMPKYLSAQWALQKKQG